MRKDKGLLAVFIVPAVILLIPLIGTLLSPEWNWGVPSFVVAYALMTGVGHAYRFLARHAPRVSYRCAAGLALSAAFLLLWVNMAVGLIGSEDNPANLMYGGVIVIGLTGAVLAHFHPAGMARTLLVVACAQALVPAIALLVRRDDFNPGVLPVFLFNFVFVGMFAVSALLFRHAAGTRDTAR